MRYTVTLPGKIGDILWAMPTVREVARVTREKVRLAVPDMWVGLKELLEEQEYVGEVELVSAKDWPIRLEAPITPWKGPDFGEGTIHLGHSGWPERSLPFMYWENLLRRYPGVIKEYIQANIYGPDMSPWISSPTGGTKYPRWIYYGMSEQWIELKAGVLLALANAVGAMFLVPGPEGGRHLEFEFEQGIAGDVEFYEAGWLMSAKLMQQCSLYVGCCSSQWVLACAMGVPVVMFDPDPGRYSDIFWWGGHERNVKVLGADGRPGWDARAVVQKVKGVLR